MAIESCERIAHTAHLRSQLLQDLGVTEQSYNLGPGPLKLEVLYRSERDKPFNSISIKPLHDNSDPKYVFTKPREVDPPMELEEPSSGLRKSFDIFVFDDVPAISGAQGENASYILQLVLDPQYPKLKFLVGIQDASINSTLTEAQTKVSDWSTVESEG